MYKRWFGRTKTHLVLVSPKSLCLLELFLDDLDYCLVGRLGPVIGFGVAWSGEGELDSLFFVEVLEFKRDELSAIVRENLLGDPKTADDVLLDEVLDLTIMDLVVGLGLHPLGEIVCDEEHVNSLPEGNRKLPHYVHPPLHERPWKEDEIKLL